MERDCATLWGTLWMDGWTHGQMDGCEGDVRAESQETSLQDQTRQGKALQDTQSSEASRVRVPRPLLSRSTGGLLPPPRASLG
eukprot:285785-Chlamydomonas_euryale.AAC.2